MLNHSTPIDQKRDSIYPVSGLYQSTNEIIEHATALFDEAAGKLILASALLSKLRYGHLTNDCDNLYRALIKLSQDLSKS